MKEAKFIKQESEYWKKVEESLHSSGELTPDQLAEAYIRLTDGLAYSKTFYKSSNTTRYLNQLTSNAHRLIYVNRKERFSRLWKFWKFEVPQAVYLARKQILFSLIVFVISAIMGAFSQAHDEEAARLFLGDQYVDETLNNISNDDPMAIYKGSGKGLMFLLISTNNIRVAFYAFVAGILFSVGSVYILVTNGFMLGLFMWFFVQKGLGWLALSTIFIHGTLELSAIFIAGGAGIFLGNSLLFPGTFTRFQSLTRNAVISLKIAVGLIPVFIVAAILESFVTGFYLEMQSIGRLLILVLSASFVIWYFFLYPLDVKDYSLEQDENPFK